MYIIECLYPSWSKKGYNGQNVCESRRKKGAPLYNNDKY